MDHNSSNKEGEGDIDFLENYANDDYLLELHRKFLEMKNQRRQAERDALVLDGRVKCLKGEEIKTLKKIEVTRMKTQEKIENIQQQEEEFRQKLANKEKKEKNLQELKERNKKMLENKKLEQSMKNEEKTRDMMEEMRQIKEQKKNNEETIKFNKLEEQSNCKTRAEYIKSQQMIAEEKRRAFELDKKMQLKQEIERKIMEEMNKKSEAEKKRQNLEEEEIEIMTRIKTTTQTHQMMVENLGKLSMNGKKTLNPTEKTC